MATYQDLGYYADGVLTILSPVRKVQQFSVTRHDGWLYEETPLDTVDETALREAQAYYQTANLKYAEKSR